VGNITWRMSRLPAQLLPQVSCRGDEGGVEVLAASLTG
jgi:hypothetical protein